jgi:hypothetical protein
MHATPDFFQVAKLLRPDRGVLQIKNVGARMAEHWEGIVPIYTQIQIQAEMWSTDTEWGSAAALIGGQHFLWTDFERSPEFCEHLVTMAREFRELVDGDIQPEAEADDVALLGKILGYTPGTSTECTDDMNPHVLEWDRLKAEIGKAEGALDYYESKIKQFMGVAEEMLVPGNGSFRLKELKKKAYTVKASTQRRFTRSKK